MTSIATSASAAKTSQPQHLKTIDAILSYHAKGLKPGESISIPLYKGPGTTTSMDPIKATRISKGAAKQPDGTANGTAGTGASSTIRPVPIERFPKMAKFIETVKKPDFTQDLRLYQEDIPKAKDEDEDEEEEAESTNPRKKRRWKRNEQPKQHWMLQPNTEFRAKWTLKRPNNFNEAKCAAWEERIKKNQHKGLPENNNSHFVLLSSNCTDSSSTPSIQVQPLHGYVNFTQPYNVNSLSMQDAERAILSNSGLSRYMMHKKSTGTSNHPLANPNANTRMGTRTRLLGKIGQTDQESDVMGDIAFRKPESTMANTSDLLSELADSDLKIDGDGILGGANDAEFGGRRKFGRMAAKGVTSGGNKRKRGGVDTGTEGMAMADDFYQRDVSAEYDELDFDPNEQFDDDDVDVGAGEIEDIGGFAADIDDDDDVNGDDDDDDDLAHALGGFATIAGMKDMVAKLHPTDGTLPVTAPKDSKEQVTSPSASTMDGVTSGSDKSDDEMTRPIVPGGKVQPPKAPGKITDTSIRYDENGLRVITKDAIRREIWLNNGHIRTQTLFKTFKITKKTTRGRKDQVLEICRELCSMEEGVLYLKQHYANMG